MNKKLIAYGVLLVSPAAFMVLANPTTANSSGALPGHTGAPGESTCLSCHFGAPLNSGTAGFDIVAPTSTVAGGPLTIGVQFSNSTNPRHGFQVTVRDSTDTFAGSWTITDPGGTRFASGSTQHITHSIGGVTKLIWNQDWNPPASPAAGPLKVYAAGNQANGDFFNSGDLIYTDQATVYQAETTVANTTWPLGSVQTVSMNAPNNAGELYILALSDSLVPTPLGGPFDLPVFTGSPFFFIPFQAPALFQNFFGVLDGSGQALATVIVPPIPILSGFQWHFAFATFVGSPPVVTEVSSAASIVIQ